MQSKAKTVAQYLASLPEERRLALSIVRKVILGNLDTNIEEGMQYGMISYHVPHRVYPAGYHCNPKQPLPFAGLASQKNYISVYLMCVYSDADERAWFEQAWARTRKKLDMGKCCIRFRKLDDVPLEVIAEAIRRMPVKKFIAVYEKCLRTMNRALKKPAKSRAAKPARPIKRAKPARKKARAL